MCQINWPQILLAPPFPDFLQIFRDIPVSRFDLHSAAIFGERWIFHRYPEIAGLQTGYVF